MRLFIIVPTVLVLSAAYVHADPKKPGPAAVKPPKVCGPKTTAKIKGLEKKTAGYAKKVTAFKGKHKEGRAPAAFCGEEKNVKKAATLAREGFPISEELEKIETSVPECADTARTARLKVEGLFMDLNSSYIQPCAQSTAMAN